ncbi:MAG: hypothetical protein PVF91_09775 [Chromatiales bacterium]|jgi:hypothetical protein
MPSQELTELMDSCVAECEEIQEQATSNLHGAIIKALVCMAEGLATLGQGAQAIAECGICMVAVPAPDGKLVEIPICALCVLDALQTIDSVAETIDCIWEVYSSFTDYLSQLNEADACASKCATLCVILGDYGDRLDELETEREATRDEIEAVKSEMDDMKSQLEAMQGILDSYIDEVIQFEDVSPEDIEAEELR